MDWYLAVLKKYAQFDGRARRKEYWMFTLINSIASFVLAFIDGFIGTYPLIFCLYTLAVLLPAFAVGIRRLHDINRSGWWVCIAFIPIVGGIWLLVLLCRDGTPGDNQYGPNPKEPAAALAI
jgi:uncharacterized membrane protein YhaH (DUF805 family)